jgi:hypothetical protein
MPSQKIQPNDEANSESFRERTGPIAGQLQRVCHDTLPWLTLSRQEWDVVTKTAMFSARRRVPFTEEI